ncbi:hypothetical protein [Streptomyces sp.]|uniref:hypothetical protein n=1 Tax=Streptomyces sp. TaxID=1931 RepID=UPI002F95ABDB
MKYFITTSVDDRTVTWRQDIADPFVHHTIIIGWPVLLRGLFRRRLKVVVDLGGDAETIFQVMNLGQPETGDPTAHDGTTS